MADAVYDEAGAQVRTVRTKGGDVLDVEMAQLKTPDTWYERAVDVDNAVAQAVKAGEAGKSHYITAFGAGFNNDAPAGKKCQIFAGAPAAAVIYVSGTGFT